MPAAMPRVRAGPREARTAPVTGVDKTEADRKLHRTLPGYGSIQGGPGGAATAVVQLGMALLQPICAVHARREPKSAVCSGRGLPRDIRKATIDPVSEREPEKRTLRPPGGSVGKEDCCWKQQTVGLVPQQSLVTKTSLKCPVGYGVRGMDG
jgi:hypothetical protein